MQTNEDNLSIQHFTSYYYYFKLEFFFQNVLVCQWNAFYHLPTVQNSSLVAMDRTLIFFIKKRKSNHHLSLRFQPIFIGSFHTCPGIFNR